MALLAPTAALVLSTGASSGIGAALARRHARPAVHLALDGRAPGRLAATRRRLSASARLAARRSA
jgi:NADP-dependent 3-hydroxy acid dehydrogenase YdfG